MKDRGLKDRVVKIKKETKELLFKPIIMSIDNVDKFEQKEMKRIRPIKNTWCDWLISYILESIRKSAGGFKDALKQTVHGRGKKLSKLKIKSKIRYPFI